MVTDFAPLPRLQGVVELLDRPDNSDEEVRGNLRDLERLNRFFGGARTVLLHLSRMIGGRSQSPLMILDIGTGGADSLARELGLDVLARIPLEPGVRTGGDAGAPITSPQHPDSETSLAAAALRELARTVAGRISVIAAPFAAARAS